MIKAALLVFFFASACAAMAYFFGADIAVSTQLKMLDVLRNTATIIFGVMGAWVAILYPRAETRVENGDSKDVRLMRALLGPVAISALIIVFTVVAHLIGPALREVTWFTSELRCVRVALYFVILAQGSALLYALIFSLRPADYLISELSGKAARNAVIKRLFRNTKKIDRQG